MLKNMYKVNKKFPPNFDPPRPFPIDFKKRKNVAEEKTENFQTMLNGYPPIGKRLIYF